MKSFILSLTMVAVAMTAYAQDDVAVGVWNWSFDNPEQGVMNGTMTIAQEGDTLKCVMSGPEGDIDMEGLEMEDNKMTKGYIMYNGMKVDFKGTFSGDNFMGKLIVDYNEMPFNATRKEE